MKTRLKHLWSLIKEAAASWSEDRAPSMGAAISYYSVFSLAPLLVIVITVAGLFFGADAVQGAVFAQVADLMGEDAAKAVGEMVQHASRPDTGSFAAIVSTLVLVIGATTVLAELQSALDIVWRVPERAKKSGLWAWLRSRLLTFGIVLALAFLMVVSLVMSAALSALGKWWGPMFGGWEGVAHTVDMLVSFGLLTVVFAVIYKLMPRASIRWHDVWIGAAVTSILFTIGKILIGLYLGKSSVASGFGAFGSLAIVLLWVYYSAQIFLFGAEFTWVYANKFGSRRKELAQAPAAPAAAKPAPVAVPATSPAYAVPVRRGASRPAKLHVKDLALPFAFIAGIALRVLLRNRGQSPIIFRNARSAPSPGT
jgi:membrane protein